MKVCFAGIEHAVEIDSQYVSVLQIESPAFFARICQSVLSGKGEDSIEPYTVWDDEGEAVNAGAAFLPIVNPFALPWKHKKLFGGLYAKTVGIAHEDDDLRGQIERLGTQLRVVVSQLGYQMQGDYAFEVEWDLATFLKAFNFNVEVPEDASLFDNLMCFVEYAADMGFDGVLLFINLHTFLAENELESFYEHVLFLGIKVLVLEGGSSCSVYCKERKLLIDQRFLETLLIGQSDRTPSTQGRICFNGFGAVTF